jgi:hypothetical protein
MTVQFLVASEAGIAIRSMKDVAEAIGAAFASGGLILTETDLGPDFFDLRSGVAGELFQKFINYRLRLAVIVPGLQNHGERFSELAREHQTHASIRIFESRAQADDWMLGRG